MGLAVLGALCICYELDVVQVSGSHYLRSFCQICIFVWPLPLRIRNYYFYVVVIVVCFSTC